MSAKKGGFTEEELSEILGVTECFFEGIAEKREAVDREIHSLLTGGHSNHLHKREMTPIEILQEDFFEFNSVKPLKHI